MHRPYFSRTRRPPWNLWAEFVNTTLSIVGRLHLGPQPSPRQTGARLSLAVRKLLECFAVQDGPCHVAALGGEEQNGRDHIGWAAVRLVGGAWSARGGQSPVDPQIGPVHKAALVAGEEQGSGRNLIRAPDPSERDRRGQPRSVVRGGVVVEVRSLDRAGGEGVDPNPAGRQLNNPGAGEGGDRGPRRPDYDRVFAGIPRD